MSIVLTRSPLEVIGMNRGAPQKRRSARLSGEGNGNDPGGNEPPAKKARPNGTTITTTTSVSTKHGGGDGDGDGDRSKAASKKKRKEYTDEADGFTFARKGGRRNKSAPAPEKTAKLHERPEGGTSSGAVESAAPERKPEAAPPQAAKKTRRRLPTTPEPGEKAKEKPVRRSKRLSDETEQQQPAPQPSPHRPSRAKSHANAERSPSPQRGRPATVEKKRGSGNDGAQEEKVMRIMLPFADTPVQRRNKEMRKRSGEAGRRSSAGMRGKRASSVIDEGRGHAMPHAEVASSEFFKHISADLTEPRRMRCLLGWCGTRLLPAKPSPPPQQSTAAARLEFQALQIAHVIQDELSHDMVNNGTLSDWFSRDDSQPPQLPLRKKPNPRNIANAAKAEELERELERLKSERAEWDELIKSASSVTLGGDQSHADGGLSPVHPEHLDSPQRAVFEQLQPASDPLATDPAAIQQRLRAISNEVEFAVDSFAHGVHALKMTRETAERVADKCLADASHVLDERERARASDHGVGQMDALRGLARVLNSQPRR